MDIIKLARELGAAIQQEQDYLDLCKAKELNDADEELQKKIEAFNELMARGEAEAEKEDADLDALGAEIQDHYDDIMSNVNMARYNECKDKLDELMNKVVAILAASVNGENPMTFDPDAMDEDEHHCGGDCCHCHGCE